MFGINYFNYNDSQYYLKEILNTVKWDSMRNINWGKNKPYKRRIALYGDSKKVYSYSGITVNPFPWNSVLIEIKNKIEKAFPVEYNSVLLNDYVTGDIGMGWHSDDEKELGYNPIIGSVSFGAERDFILKHKTDKKIEKEKILITNGSYLIMFGNTQKHWLHSVPIRRKIKDRRINLTFRKII